ncbi:hypothetical protein SNE40_012862 [Patella caerulea]|uniref:Uncharacterized protein n=1 Tax=Patella caerulea TaxID=87958 RepID=A0AAN8PMF1_PATCE
MAVALGSLLQRPAIYIATGVAGVCVVYGLYRAWRYFRPNTEDEYFERIKNIPNPGERRVLILGLDGAGKTRFARCFCKGRRRLGSTEETTVGFYVNSVTLGEIYLNMWDVGGSANCRGYWKEFVLNLDAICYCVDSSQPARFDEARRELHTFLKYEQTKGIPLILIATKRDKIDSVSPFALYQHMNLDLVKKKRPVYLVGVQAPDSGARKGFMETYRLLVSIVEDKKKKV